MKNLFLDIETTSLVPKEAQSNWETMYDKYPHIVQMAWDVPNPNPAVASLKQFIIFQEGREIPAEASAIHGITTEMGNDPYNTYPLGKVLEELMYDGLQVDKMIGFNIYFDSSIIKANTIRHFGIGSKEDSTMRVVLDKSRRVDVMRKVQRYMDGKWRPLTALYEKLFNEKYDGAHGAGADVTALVRCCDALVSRGIIPSLT